MGRPSAGRLRTFASTTKNAKEHWRTLASKELQGRDPASLTHSPAQARPPMCRSPAIRVFNAIPSQSRFAAHCVQGSF